MSKLSKESDTSSSLQHGIYAAAGSLLPEDPHLEATFNELSVDGQHGSGCVCPVIK
jgi:hypothetical protein